MTGYYDDPELQLCDHLYPCAVCDAEPTSRWTCRNCGSVNYRLAKIEPGLCEAPACRAIADKHLDEDMARRRNRAQV